VAKIEKGLPVSISVLVPVLRMLKIVDNLEMLLPEIGVSPIEVLKLKGKRPQRVKRRKSS